MAKMTTEEERVMLLALEICPGVTYRDALKALPEVDIEAIMAMDAKEIVTKMQNYVIARLHIEFMAGNPAAMGPVSKLHLEPHLARAKVTAVLQGGAARKGLGQGGMAGIQVEGKASDMDALLSRVLSGNVHLPEGDAATGLANLQEVKVG